MTKPSTTLGAILEEFERTVGRKPTRQEVAEAIDALGGDPVLATPRREIDPERYAEATA